MSEETRFVALEKLRVPFVANQISLLPKPMKKREEMDKLPKAKCKECGGYHATSMVIHLSYVGHAALTDRLLDVDPLWNWEPLSFDHNTGLPTLDKDGGLWIKLTVCGVTRLGYGDAQGKSGGDAMKERIGDALRNAAMRFGAALDLWHKGDLHAEEDDGGNKSKPHPQQPPATQPEAQAAPGKGISGMKVPDVIKAIDAECDNAANLDAWWADNEPEVRKMKSFEQKLIVNHIAEKKSAYLAAPLSWTCPRGGQVTSVECDECAAGADCEVYKEKRP